MKSFMRLAAICIAFLAIFSGYAQIGLTPETPLPPAPLDDAMKTAVQKTKLLSESLADYAREGSKVLENVPKLIATSKEFFNQSMSLIATIKNDIQQLRNSFSTINQAASDQDRLKQLVSLVDLNLALLNALAQLNLLSAQVVYTCSDTIIEPFHGEMGAQGMSTSLLIREITKEVTSVTKEFHNILKKYK